MYLYSFFQRESVMYVFVPFRWKYNSVILIYKLCALTSARRRVWCLHASLLRKGFKYLVLSVLTFSEPPPPPTLSMSWRMCRMGENKKQKCEKPWTSDRQAETKTILPWLFGGPSLGCLALVMSLAYTEGKRHSNSSHIFLDLTYTVNASHRFSSHTFLGLIAK